MYKSNKFSYCFRYMVLYRATVTFSHMPLFIEYCSVDYSWRHPPANYTISQFIVGVILAGMTCPVLPKLLTAVQFVRIFMNPTIVETHVRIYAYRSAGIYVFARNDTDLDVAPYNQGATGVTSARNPIVLVNAVRSTLAFSR